MIATRPVAFLVLAALLGGCGLTASPVAAPRAAEVSAVSSADATPREVAKLLDKDGDGLVTELEGWVSGAVDGERFANFAVLGKPGKPVPTSTIERALGVRGEVVIYALAGGTRPDGKGTTFTTAARNQLAQGLAKILAADPLSVAGQVPVRVVKMRHYAFRDPKDAIETFKAGALATEIATLLAKGDVLMRVKLVSEAALQGRKHRLVLTDHTTF